MKFICPLHLQIRLLSFALFLASVSACDDPTGIPGAQLRVAPDSIILKSIGETRSLSAQLTRSDGTPIDALVKWRSESPDIATISSAGTVTAVRVGTAVIEAQAGGSRGRATVVVQPIAASIEIDPYTALVAPGDTVKLRATVRDGRGNVIAGHRVFWASFTSQVDTVGIVVIRTAGHVHVIAFADSVTSDTARFVSRVRYDNIITAGGRHSCSITLQGQSYCWGYRGDGALGSGFTACCASAPVQAYGGPGIRFKQISAGARHTCAIDEQDRGYCWGSPSNSGTWYLQPWNPQQLDSTLVFRSIAAGTDHSCGVLRDGSVWCWGRGAFGQIGTETIHSQLPIPVNNTISFTAIDAGGQHTCAIGVDMHAYCWGANDFGQLGIGTQDTLAHPTPTRVVSDRRFTAITTGETHTCAIDESNQLYCWGNNHLAQLTGGVAHDRCNVAGGTWACATVPVAVLLPASVTQVSAGSNHTCALVSGAAAFCWGDNSGSKAGSSSLPILATAVQIPGAWTAVAAGATNSCGVQQQIVVCWGDNTYGQLGAGEAGPPSAEAIRVLYQQ